MMDCMALALVLNRMGKKHLGKSQNSRTRTLDLCGFQHHEQKEAGD
jgi:hypothetical protein